MPKTEVQEKIKKFFEKEDFSSEEIKKTKRLTMKYGIKLRDYKKRFCKKCLNNLKGKIRIKNGIKSVECCKCGSINRWKVKPS